MPRSSPQFDVFVSYASEDREACILPLLSRLREEGITAWCDVHELTWGDSIVEGIQRGFGESVCVIAFISEAYLRKPWPLKELNVALTRQVHGVKLLPVMLGIDFDRVHALFPFLVDLKYLAIRDYVAGTQLDQSIFDSMLIELGRAREKWAGIEVLRSFRLAKLSDPIQKLFFHDMYQSTSIASHTEAVIINYVPRFYRTPSEITGVESDGAVVNLQSFLTKCFGELSISDSTNISCIDNNHGRYLLALDSGSYVWCGLGLIRDQHLHRSHYVRTEAPPNPRVVKYSTQVIRGYASGQLYVNEGSTGAGKLLSGHSAAITAIDTTPQSYIITGCESGQLGVWTATDGVLCRLVDTENGAVRGIVAQSSASPHAFAAGHADGTISLWSIDGICQNSVRVSDTPIGPFALLSDYIIVATECMVRIVRITDGASIYAFPSQSARITALEVSSSGAHGERAFCITCGCGDGTVSSWMLSQRGLTQRRLRGSEV